MKIVLYVLMFMLIASPLLAQENAEQAELEKITVTATKMPRKVEEVSASVEVVTKEEVQNSKGWNVGESIQNLSGVQAVSSNGAYDTHIIIRGAGAKAQYGVREIMIMVDGVPVTDPDSLSRLDMVDTSMIERVEVVKGPNSTLYGANSAGGVINIITKSPVLYQGVDFRAGYGAYNSQDYHLQYGGSFKDLYYIVSGSHRSTDSWRDHNEFKSNQAAARFNYVISDTSDLELVLNYTNAKLDLPGRLTKEQFEDDPTQQSAEWQHTARDSESKKASLSHKKEFSGGSELKTQVYAQKWYHFHPVPIRINDGGAVVYGLDVQDNIPFEVAGKRNMLSMGLSGQRDQRDSKSYTYRDMETATIKTFKGPVTVALPPFSQSDEKGEVMEDTDNKVNKWGVFLQETIWLTEGTILDLGIRYDQVTFKIDNEIFREWAYVTSKNGTAYFNYVENHYVIDLDKTWDAVSPRAGINHSIVEGANVYAAIGTGFQTPTQSELETNEDLKPQKALNYEAGFKGNINDRHTLDVTYFHTTIEDEMLKLMDQTGVSFYDNAGETLHRGVEVSGSVGIVNGLDLGANYTYSDFTFVDYVEMERTGYPPVLIEHVRDGNYIPLVPKHKYSVTLNYRHPTGAYARVGSTTWGKYFVDTANDETYAGFTTVNSRVGYDGKALGLFVQVDNIMDETYAAEVTESYGNIRYSPGAPRTWSTGVTYRF
jgi:iron complex outermembrane receptor protein